MDYVRHAQSVGGRLYAISEMLASKADLLIEAEQLNYGDLADVREWEEAIRSVREEIGEELGRYVKHRV